MTRGQALTKARAAKAAQRTRDERIHREILTLRRQLGAELGRSTFGSSGLNINMGQIQEEYVPELKTLRGRLDILERMANDPVVRGQLRAISYTLISGVRWKVVGGKPEHRDLVAANLLRQGPKRFWCSTSWIDRLYEALGCLVHGVAIFGKTRLEVDGKIIFSELKWLHPRSLSPSLPWEMDDKDNLLALNRQFRTPDGGYKQERIPASEIFLVPWDRRGPNWEGNAFIRPMYKPWKMRELAEKIDLIDLQNRGVGIPLAKLSAQGGTKERDALKAIIADLRGGSKERAFIVLEKDEEVKFLTSEGQAREAQTILDGKRADIVKSAGTEYLESGNTQSGSRASSSSMATGFFINVDAIRIILEDIFNFGAGPFPGLVEELVDMNDPSPETIEEYPRIEGSRVSPTEQLDNIPLLTDTVQKGAVPANLKLTNHILRNLNAPELSPQEYDEATKAKAQQVSQFPGQGGAGRPDGAGTDQEGRDDTASRRFATSSLSLAEKKTPDAPRPSSRRASYPWVASTPS